MPVVRFLTSEGQEIRVDAAVGQSLMETAVKHSVPRITADCGGACTCATCHVYVDDAWLEKLPPPDEMEASMLEFSEQDVKPNSRLACQIRLSPALDGLTVQVPD